jgi:hypothetical protein
VPEDVLRVVAALERDEAVVLGGAVDGAEALVAFEYDVANPAAIRPTQVQFNQSFSIDVDKHLYQ